MTQDEIIEMAQECGLVGMRPHLDGIYVESLVAFAKLVAEKAIKEALARPEQEPVACKHEWFRTGAMEPGQCRCIKCGAWNTAPPQRTWVGLTDEEISELIRATHNTGSFVRAIEAKLKEKNT